MIQIHRARLGMVVAVVGALVFVGMEFPLSELLQQHRELALVRAQMSTLASRNVSLHADISALSSDSTVNALAHEEYGLVRPGQSSYVILPAANSAAAKEGLSTPAISPQDLLASAPTESATTQVATNQPTASFWSRFESRLEFWHWGR